MTSGPAESRRANHNDWSRSTSICRESELSPGPCWRNS